MLTPPAHELRCKPTSDRQLRTPRDELQEISSSRLIIGRQDRDQVTERATVGVESMVGFHGIREGLHIVVKET